MSTDLGIGLTKIVSLPSIILQLPLYNYCLDPMVGCIADTVAVHVFLSAADCSACSTVQSCPRVLFFILRD